MAKEWFTTADENDYLTEEADDIFQYIYLKVVTYPQEISGDLGYGMRTTLKHLRQMFNAQKIAIVSTPFQRPPMRLLLRLDELQATGLSGTAIRKKTWYCVHETGAALTERLRAEGRGMELYSAERLRYFMAEGIQ